MRPARKPGAGVPGSDCPELYRDRATRGAKSAKARAAVHLVEGSYVTFAQMTTRLQVREPAVTLDQVRNRFQSAQRHGRPMTWQELARVTA